MSAPLEFDPDANPQTSNDLALAAQLELIAELHERPGVWARVPPSRLRACDAAGTTMWCSFAGHGIQVKTAAEGDVWMRYRPPPLEDALTPFKWPTWIEWVAAVLVLVIVVAAIVILL